MKESQNTASKAERLKDILKGFGIKTAKDDRHYDRKTGSEKFGIIKAAQRGKIGTLTRCA